MMKSSGLDVAFARCLTAHSHAGKIKARFNVLECPDLRSIFRAGSTVPLSQYSLVTKPEL